MYINRSNSTDDEWTETGLYRSTACDGTGYPVLLSCGFRTSDAFQEDVRGNTMRYVPGYGAAVGSPQRCTSDFEDDTDDAKALFLAQC